MKSDVVIIGGGQAGCEAGVRLLQAGKRCIIVSRGMSLNPTRQSEFIAMGGGFIGGDTVLRGEFQGDRITGVRTRKLESTLLEAENFLLCTGKFFSRGLVSTMTEISEPIFHSDVEYKGDFASWCNPDFYGVQPFESFGVKTDVDGRVLRDGVAIGNLYAAGEILAGEIDIVQSALRVCGKLI